MAPDLIFQIYCIIAKDNSPIANNISSMKLWIFRNPFPMLLMLAGFLLICGCKREPYPQGKILYENFCANCHMENGSGLEGLIPPVVGSNFVRDQPEATACIIRYGRNEPMEVNGQRYLQPMPGSPQLSDFEITNIINYIRHAWNNDHGYVTLKMVRSALEKCETD